MNLIKREVDMNNCNILEFREYQYNLISDLISLGFTYLESHGFTYDKSKFKIEKIDDIAYNSKHHFATLIIKCKITDAPKSINFFEFVIPKLMEGQFYRLNGSHYIPQFYIADSPITIKKNSISLYSLFSPITLFGTENRVIFLGNNIPIYRFLRLYYTDDEIQKLNFPFNINIKNETIDFILQNFSKILNIPPDQTEIIKKIDLLFLDNWTKGLYEEYYGITPTLKNIIDKVNEIGLTDISFIDLKYKRLIMIEYLMEPFFKSISHATQRLVLENFNPKYLNIKIGDIISNFYSVLLGANRFDIVNGYTGLLNLKASFKNPKGNDELPKEVTNIHPSFKGRICPVVISNTSPGETVQLIPEQNLKSLKYGIFGDL